MATQEAGLYSCTTVFVGGLRASTLSVFFSRKKIATKGKLSRHGGKRFLPQFKLVEKETQTNCSILEYIPIFFRVKHRPNGGTWVARCSKKHAAITAVVPVLVTMSAKHATSRAKPQAILLVSPVFLS